MIPAKGGVGGGKEREMKQALLTALNLITAI